MKVHLTRFDWKSTPAKIANRSEKKTQHRKKARNPPNSKYWYRIQSLQPLRKNERFVQISNIKKNPTRVNETRYRVVVTIKLLKLESRRHLERIFRIVAPSWTEMFHDTARIDDKNEALWETSALIHGSVQEVGTGNSDFCNGEKIEQVKSSFAQGFNLEEKGGWEKDLSSLFHGPNDWYIQNLSAKNFLAFRNDIPCVGRQIFGCHIGPQSSKELVHFSGFAFWKHGEEIAKQQERVTP